jgi:type IV secretory pathway VirD2 relaxase
MDEREFRLYPRRPRFSRANEPRAWSLAFKQVLYFARMSRKARRSAFSGSSGRPRKPYRQRCTVRVIYSQNKIKTRGQWKAHGRYIMREAATRNSDGRGAFNDGEEAKDLVATLDDWQKSGDKRLFKFIISPEFGDRVDLERLTRDLMARMERDLATRLEWVAVSHFNTGHPHVHVALRGRRADGSALMLGRDYVRHGIRAVAEDLCTIQLGYRTSLDAADAYRREVRQFRYTSLDRMINRSNAARQVPGADDESLYFTIRLNPNDPDLQGFPKSLAHHIAARLLTLKDMGFAETMDGDSWRVRCDFESILRAMQRANDRQKMLAAHGALLSDERLQLVVADFRKLKSLEGRVVLHGEEEAGQEAGRIYLLLEGTDGRLHHVYYTPEIHYARSLGKLRTNSFIRLRRMFTEEGRPKLEVEDLGDAEKLIQNKRHFLEGARRLIKRDIIPVEDGWNGWLGRYQSALVHAAEEIHNDRDRKVEIEVDHGSRGRR